MEAITPFFWATGIENTFIPQERPGLRALDEYELTQHYRFWRSDIDRVAELGVSHIRWGIPWYRVNPRPGAFEWGWIDDVLDHLVNKRGIQPIVDLMHYGTPEWLEGSFVHPDYPSYVAEYAHAVAERYGNLVRYYTPLNEPTVNADRCGRQGEWPPYLKGEEGNVAVLLPLARGMVRTAAAVRAADPDAIFVQVEALGWLWTANEALEPEVERRMAHTYLGLDLYTGRVDESHPLWGYLRQNGASETELIELHQQAGPVDILGVNLYPWSGGEVVAVDQHHQGELTGHHLGHVLRDAWRRYQLPMMITETSARRDVAGRRQWMDETIAAVADVRAAGLPVLGYTWFPALTMIDWEYRLGDAPLADYLLHLGLWDSAFDADGTLQRHPTPLVARYRHYVTQGWPRPGEGPPLGN